MTLGARIANDLPRAVTRAARAANRKETLLIDDFATAMARRAVAGPATWLAAGTFAAFASLHARHLDLGAHAEHGVLETKFQIVANVFAALRAAALASAAGISKKVAETEEIAQDVAEIGEG